ncbi:hypothetical protein AB670_03113 [Chryseobacterium sp. MOF25P]|uniref:hypothetical protein n=1 Tax=unclassified Chryseobacterium TaxID=2593645 RepID=UPI000804DF02|nr:MULTISPECIES: hypothetical protein [unclassified Chryseobacterium]OBW40646.1 hypothetical protein AB670_03113 [Chryseobacterium sp. MOF25P]OBW44779.1 hypothetical protein AB671_03223 [Chryseobacterium sp. BGARF1]
MKTFFKFLAITSSVFVYSQQTQQVNQGIGYEFFPTKSVTSNGKTLKYEDIIGTPYADTDFKMAKLADNYEEVPVRYNSYKDEVEFKKGENIQVVPKQKEFSRITIKKPSQTIVNLETNDNLQGYFFELVPGKIALYKKEKTVFKDEVPAINSYAASKPAEFIKQNPVYYIKTENNFIKKPKNQKEIIEAFPSLKDQINTYFKSNKVKFNNEEDLIKLVNHLNQQS